MIKIKRIAAFSLVLVLLLFSCKGQPVQTGSVSSVAEEISSSTSSQEASSSVSSQEVVSSASSQETVSSVSSQESSDTTQPSLDLNTLVNNLSTEEKVGQLFLARCPSAGALQDIQTYHLGGYVLFGMDFKDNTPDDMSAVIADFQKTASIPLLIAVDEEGGTVNRVSSYTQYRDTPFPSPRDLYAQGGLALITETEKEKCQLLRSLGINVNLAPVCDITTDSNAFMYRRSLGQSPEETANFVSSVLQVMAEYQIGGVLKHFPGYGNNVDTHVGIAVDNRSLTELEAVDLVPFAGGIDAGCGAIMVSHTFINALDTEYPATLSAEVHKYLRNEMGFDGVIMTDDLSMQAITDLYGAKESAVFAVLAGNDLLCSSEYQVQYTAVLNAVQTGQIPESLLDQAVIRILRWKQELGLTML